VVLPLSSSAPSSSASPSPWCPRHAENQRPHEMVRHASRARRRLARSRARRARRPPRRERLGKVDPPPRRRRRARSLRGPRRRAARARLRARAPRFAGPSPRGRVARPRRIAQAVALAGRARRLGAPRPKNSVAFARPAPAHFARRGLHRRAAAPRARRAHERARRGRARRARDPARPRDRAGRHARPRIRRADRDANRDDAGRLSHDGAMSFELTVNGTRRVVEDEPVHRTLLQWLRATGLTGTKEGCAEGDCGACTVAVVDRDAKGAPTYRAINACIALLPSMAGREIVTVEGLEHDELHPVQRAMVEQYGSQCGYCTPGFVMSMFEGYYRAERDPAKIGEQLHGNLCRCTGYRPIREAMVAALEAPRDPNDLFQLRLGKNVPALAPAEHAASRERFFRPSTIDALCKLLAEHPESELLGGATEIGVEINKKARQFPTLIATDAVPELARVWRDSSGWHVGGAATLTQIEEALAGELPAIDKMLRVFASRQIRHRATLAGNVVTASPIGDMPPILLALDAEVVLRSVRGERRVPIDAFFTGYRKTARARDEVVTEIWW